MRPVTAFDLGYRSARSGFFFDAMELLAFVAPTAGGVEALKHPMELLFRRRDETRADMDWVADLVGQAYRRPCSPPAGVDEYRSLLTDQVFDIVNRWSFIDDIKTVNRLQAWFYAGFGLGRTETVCRAFELLIRLRDIQPGDRSAVDAALPRLQRLAAEASRQLEIPASEDDLSIVSPLLLDASRSAQALALRAQRSLDELVHVGTDVDTLAACEDTAKRIRLTLAHVGASLA
jgi:hypothetical protein